ncbi:MAG: Bug family tripartite tricarboxylate transporter substrate binding protein [Lautropia sp.]
MRILRAFVLATASCLISQAALAQSPADGYPNKVIRIVVPWAAGGFTDVLARLIADKMTKSMGQTVIVDNRPGASGAIGSKMVAQSPPDGYTLLLNTSDATVKLLQDKTPDPAADFAPISLIGTQPVVVAVGKHVPVASFAEFVARAKAAPGKINFGSPGEGSAVHLGMELLASAAGMELNHVPYKGMGPALTDLLGGQIDAVLVSFQGSAGNFKNGKLTPLAVSSLKRSAVDPSVPTIAESGVQFELLLWYALIGPKGLPEPIVARLNSELKAALTAPDLLERLTSAGTEPIGSSPQELQRFVDAEVAKWKKAIK